MPISGENVNSSLRKTLADSHVSAIAIAMLLFRSLDSALWVLWGPLSDGPFFFFSNGVIFDVVGFSRALMNNNRFSLFLTFSWLLNSLVYLAAAVLLSRWVYGMGPLRSLSKYGARLSMGNDV
jgi:hypothetical protein